jgi:hypothetical protein
LRDQHGDQHLTNILPTRLPKGRSKTMPKTTSAGNANVENFLLPSWWQQCSHDDASIGAIML